MTESLKRKISTIGAQVTSIISVALVLLIIGLIMVTATVTSDAGAEMRRQMALIVKLVPNTSESEALNIKKRLETSDAVEYVSYTSAATVLAEERTYHREMLQLLGDINPYSAELGLHLSSRYANADSVASIISELQLMPQIDEVYAQPDILENANVFFRGLRVYLVILGLVMVLISCTLIFNTVSMAVYTRRFVIHTMQLVGATAEFIRRPFIRSALQTAVISAVLAIVLLILIRLYSSSLDYDMLFAVTWARIFGIFTVMLLSGAALCIGAVFLATNRYIGASYDDLYT